MKLSFETIKLVKNPTNPIIRFCQGGSDETLCRFKGDKYEIILFKEYPNGEKKEMAWAWICSLHLNQEELLKIKVLRDYYYDHEDEKNDFKLFCSSCDEYCLLNEMSDIETCIFCSEDGDEDMRHYKVEERQKKGETFLDYEIKGRENERNRN